jgi:hypothetical protein
MNDLSEMPRCVTSTCGENGIVMLTGQALCLAHFLEGCYRKLDRLDLVGRGKSRVRVVQQGAPKEIEELVKQALIVCLQHKNLNNLDRSRLLDILLWAGELQFVMRVPQSISKTNERFRCSIKQHPGP